MGQIPPVGRTLFALVALMTAACASEDPAPPNTPRIEPASSTNVNPCSEGFAPMDGADGCAPVLPPPAADGSNACPTGSRAVIGSAKCVQVGVTSCAKGFGKQAWGCDAIIAPSGTCTGSQREELGATTCRAVSDCAAPFPPPGATLFVNTAFTDGELDATHFRKIADAVAVATDNAVIAVDTGRYVEGLVLSSSDVSIVGRCSEKVTLEQTPGVVGSGIEVQSRQGIVIKNITMRGFNAAVSVLGGKATLESMVIEDGRLAGVVVANDGADVRMTNVVVRNMRVREDGDQAFGVLAFGGANLEIDDCVFSGNEVANVGAAKRGTTVHMTRTIVRDGKPFGTSYGIGVFVTEGASMTIEESAIVDNSAAGINVYATDSGQKNADKNALTLRRSVVRGTKFDAAKHGSGVEASLGTVAIEESTIRDSAEVELSIGPGASAAINDTTLVGRPQSSDDDRGAIGFRLNGATAKTNSLAIVNARSGIEVQGTSKLDFDRSLVQATRRAHTIYEASHWIGVGILVEKTATLTMADATVEDVRAVGVLVTGHAALTGTLVRGTRPALDGTGGRGFSLQNGGVAQITRSAFVDNAECGVVAMMRRASLTLSASTIQDTSFNNERFGIGLVIGGDAIGTIDATTITKSKGVGLLCAAAGATVRTTTISKNAIGVHVQNGTELEERDVPVGEDGAPHMLTISSDTRFVENHTRAGSSVVALPPSIER